MDNDNHRRHDALQRRTVIPSLGELFLSKQFWYEQEVATIWWDFDLFYHSLLSGLSHEPQKWRLLCNFHERVAVDVPEDGELRFLYQESQSMVPALLQELKTKSTTVAFVIINMSFSLTRFT